MAANYSYGNIGYSNTIFTGERDIKDGTIYSVGTGRERIKVGVDLEREQELLQANSDMQDTLDNWREILIQNGLLKMPKTPEEIAREAAEQQLALARDQAQQQASINQALLDAISGIQNQIGELKNNGGTNGYSVEPSVEQVGSDSQEDREVAGGSKASPRARKTNTGTKPK